MQIKVGRPTVETDVIDLAAGRVKNFIEKHLK